MKRRRRTDLLLLLSTVLAALAGQYYFSQLPDRFWDGVAFYAVAIFCLNWLLTRRLSPDRAWFSSLWRQIWQVVREHPGQVWALVIGLVSLYTAVRLTEAGRYGQAVLFWLLSIGACIGAWAGLRQEPIDPLEESSELPSAKPENHPQQDSSGEKTGKPRSNSAGVRLFRGDSPGELDEAVRARGKESLLTGRWEIGLVAGCTLLGLLLRLVKLGTIPFLIGGDEASMGLEAVHVLEGTLTNPFATGWLSHPTLYFFVLAGPVGLLGHNAWGLRLLSPFVGSATIPVLYLLGRRLFDRRVAFASMALLTVAHLHIHFSRLGINNVYDPLFGLLTFLFLVRGLQEGRILDFALSGVFLGLGQFFYMGGRLIPILMAVYIVLWLWLRPASRSRFWLPITALGSSFFMGAGPLLYFFVRFPDDFLARLRMVGIIQSGWLKTEQQIAGKTALQLLWDQVRKSLLAFNYTLDPTSWYGARIPYLDFLSGVLFVLGLVILLRRWRERGYLLVNVWFWLALVFGGVLIENPPSSPRFVIFVPAVCLVAALGLDGLLGLLPIPRSWAFRAMVFLLILATALNVGYYFFRYTPAGIFGGLNTEVGTRIGEYLQYREPGYVVYFFGPPRMWIGYATIPYLAPDMEGVDIETPLIGPPTFVDPSKDALFIFLPEREGELGWVEQAYPEGQREDVFGHGGDVLFIVYQVGR